ncbi:hypothetical protein H072_2892 [Dactylellina haptotyla CBS 200.50]|uniref:Uncharacterized protein n=1 Tax=Dactylellina haptotyla (strain CBS 200.50) TaxID=1284197 RepID=S8AJQ2_DACHA|nr:hypothetical protein H072_2892 [Dactylellina haptotyla CBS 200.50]
MAAALGIPPTEAVSPPYLTSEQIDDIQFRRDLDEVRKGIPRRWSMDDNRLRPHDENSTQNIIPAILLLLFVALIWGYQAWKHPNPGCDQLGSIKISNCKSDYKFKFLRLFEPIDITGARNIKHF